ncbi:MAG: hypothetical protein U5K72_04445 [Balneolaceae bacterium]|nr:hypothetical protein [Balneolaceae bacterium]
MIIKAVIEDITTEGIVILLGEEEKEITIHKDKLWHISDYKVGDWLDVIFEKGKITSVQLNRKN